MKVDYAFPINDMRGKTQATGGFVAGFWRGIKVFRQNVIPRNPNSTNQALIRNILATASQGYKAISAGQKTAWAAYAAGKKIKVFGKEITIPEISAYVKVNVMRLIDGEAVDPAAPTILSDFIASDIATVGYVEGTTVLSFIVTHNASIVTNRLWAVKITGSMASARVVPKVSDFRLANGVTADSIIPVTSSPQTISITAPVFGNWSDQDTMGIKVVPLSEDYDLGTEFSSTVVVTVT